MEKFKFVFWKEAKGFKDKSDVEDECVYYSCWVSGDSGAGVENRIVERLEDEFRSGAKRGVVFDTSLDIPENFFEARPEIKILYKNEVREFKNRADAISFLKDKANEEEYVPGHYNPYSEERRCAFNAWLIRHGCCRVVDKESKIPNGFYD